VSSKKMIGNFINPEDSHIQYISRKISEFEDPISPLLGWFSDKFTYGMSKCIDLELELQENTCLRSAEEVIKNKEYTCVDGAFLLTSILRNIYDPEDVKLALMGNNDLFAKYIFDMGTSLEIEWPYDHVGVLINEEFPIWLQELKNSDPQFYLGIEDFQADNVLHLQKNHGMLNSLKTDWVPLRVDNNFEIQGCLVDEKLQYVSKLGRVAYMELWDLSEMDPHRLTNYFMTFDGHSEQIVPEEQICLFTRNALKEYAPKKLDIDSEKFANKLRQRIELGNLPKSDVSYI
jgi:hypothetical protein